MERGAIAFLYRPRVQTEVTRALEDVQAFYVILLPEGREVARRIRVGRKRLPDGRRRERFWAHVERIGARPADVLRDVAATEYWTKTRGLRHQPGPRLAATGAYAIARHEGHAHLAYALPPAGRPSEVRDELRIAPQASLVVVAFRESVEGAPAGRGEARRFVPLGPEHLDVAGAELVLIAAGDPVAAELGAALDPAAESATAAALREHVRAAGGGPASAPLLDGVWR